MWFRSLIDGLKPPTSRAASKRRKIAPPSAVARRLIFESLEDRTLLSGTPRIREVTVLSRNLYHGANLEPAIAALATGNPAVFIPAVSEVWAKVRATDFPQRAEALADEVLRAQPTLIGLQEAALWQTGPALDPAPASHVEYDFLQNLVDELAERGLHYAVATTNVNWAAEAPAVTHRGVLEDLRLTDRDALLVRTDLPVSVFQVTGVQSGDFIHNLIVPLPSGPFVTERGWTAVDAAAYGQAFRFVNTHLEPESTNPLVNAIQVAQANELLAGPGATMLPTIFAGDFNSRADGMGTASYGVLVGAGFTDAWTVTHPSELGNTSGHAENLLNSAVNLTQRLDLVLFRGDVAPLSVEVVGDEPGDRLPSGLWPSDHAGVVASLRIHDPPQIEQVVVNDGSPQRSKVTSLTVQFSEQVALDTAAIEVRRQGGGSFTTHVATQVLAGKTVAVVTFAGRDVIGGSLADGRYQLILHAGRIRDDHDNSLDGDGDGTAGGDHVQAFFRLYGDSDGDGDVDQHDVRTFLRTLGRKRGDARYLDYMDFSGDNRVGVIDLLAFARRIETHLNA
jgi:endonuclease/exonuclease/phosphatase family metal-dependent hydrolase